jgi:hypothetical protein
MNCDEEKNIFKILSQKFGIIKKLVSSLHPQNDKHAKNTVTY